MTTSSDFKETFEKIYSGEIEPPNLAHFGLSAGMNVIASDELRPTGVGYAKVSRNGVISLARYFLEYTQAGTFTGNGYIALSGDNDFGGFASFAICLHQKVLDPRANLLQGWAPAHCEKCGLDMTVDSGD